MPGLLDSAIRINKVEVEYTEGFVNPKVFKWSTQSNRTLAFEEVKKIIQAKELGIGLHLFVKKDDDEGTDFYYLGGVTPDKNAIEKSLESKLYHYIASEED